ncbi:MAG: recombinase [Acidimicrobiaceae bacterium]|nr:phosphate acyltransferase [Acidimicrobiaceae bacterium]MXW61948.1 recombinase [Acidimicrobiaceae bacterium]MXW76513.1 recombinase [Acidimicrobiaceae bacterium]MYA73800.1 recombinase [Acidimicrobiaceae bacterium]MYC43757.1 recombinase [Acidimicrobiaceae bacterium]
MSVLEDWYSSARANPQRIILADAQDQRAISAADRLNGEGLAEALVAGRDFGSLAEVGHGPAEKLLGDLAGVVSGPWANRRLDVDDPLVISAALVKTGWAAGCVAGASRASADVVRAGLRVLGVATGVEALSSCFFFVLPDGRPMVYGDCGVLPDPDEAQLASVAVSSAATFAQLSGEEPRVAMLSFSTKGSAQHPRVEKVRNATAIARRSVPDLKIDGELQFDAAWVPAVAEAKAPGSDVAGRANVFVFPDLDSGNIAYKITERLGKAMAFGPLLQGLDGVLHDLSRGCSEDDIVNVAVIASIQASGLRQV